MAVRHEASAEETGPETFAGLHSLHGQVCPHGLGYGIEILASLQALLCKSLDLGASAREVSFHAAMQVGNKLLTCSGTKSEPTARSY